jgi:hypothetical protein
LHHLRRVILAWLGHNADLNCNQVFATKRKEGDMGILTRKQGTGFVIGSDRSATDAPTTRPPKGRPSDIIAVWTGETWSAVMTEAMMFDTLDDADEYVRANSSKVAGPPSPTKPSIKRPAESAPPSPPVAEP